MNSVGSTEGQDLGNAQLLIAGTRLTVSPEAQTVPFDTPTIVNTQLEGYDAANGMLPPELQVVADFTGPGIDGVLPLSTRPNEPFRIPRLSLKGQYQLDNIRLVHRGELGDELLVYAEPRSAGVLVTQVLVTRVTSRALTLDEIRNYGIVVDEDNFKAFNFTFGFGVDGDTFDYDVPVLFNPGHAGDPQRVQFLYEKVGFGRSWGTTSTRFRPPQIAPFTLELKDNTGGSGEIPVGGCLNPFSDCRTTIAPPIPGVVLFPTDVAMLHQFFSVMVLAKNDAPVGDPLVIRDLTAKMVLPPGLRQAETEPPTPLGVPIPVRVPGPDGRLGTGDDISFLVAQATGQAEALVEGRQEGVQIVEFQLEGVLDGLPDGQIRRVEGTARGAVLVRDATLGITISHPDVVRTDEEYSLLLTVSNTSVAPANLISFTLPVSGLSGVTVVGEATKSIASLLPGESEVVEFRLLSQRTGRVFATSARSGSEVSPSFDLTAGVGENDIPLSPTSIILPRQTESLPPELNRRALALVGLAFSIATAPANEISPTLPQLVLNEVDEKVYWLGQMGRQVSMGGELFDSASIFAAEWHGVHDHHWEWDELRRTTEKGALLADELGGIFAQEAVATSPLAAFDRHTATTAYLGPMQGALAVGTGAHLEVASRTSGLTISGVPTDTGRVRDLAFAEQYDLGGAEMVTLAVAEENGYQARLTDTDGGTSALHLRVPDGAGALRRVSWSLVSLSPGGVAVVDFDDSFTDFTLYVDTEGDGLVDEQIPGTVQTLQPRAFSALAAVQNSIDPSGHLIEVLFTQDVDLVSLLPRDPQRFTIPGKISNGGLIPSEEGITQKEADRRAQEGAPPGSPLAEPVINPFAGLRNSRIVRVVFNNPISPYVQSNLTVRDLQSMTGQQVVGVTLPVQTTVADPGGLVQGTVIGPDGQPVPFARVDLFEVDSFPGEGCGRHRTASVQADAAGSFLFDYVRQTTCSDIFTLAAQNPESGAFGTARGRIRLVGGTAQLDIVMLGRGTVRGRVTYEDGTVPVSPRVIASSPVFSDGREARVDANGFYEVDEIPVGTVTLGAADGEGNFVYQTVEIPTAGAVTERNLVIIRRPPDLSTGDVRGTVYESDGLTPLFDAYVALYIDGELVGVRRSALDGSFDFGTVPTGGGEIEAFDGQTGLLGAQILFDVLPDQVNDIPVLLQDDRGVVEGHVLRQTNQGTSPVAGAVVWAQGTPFNTVTDAQGFYRLEGVFAGARTILAADVERQVQTSASVSVNPDGSTVTRDLIFFDTSSVIGGIAGEVLGFNGSPVSAALHLAAPGDDKWWGIWSTGVNGTFFIPDLGPGTYEVHAIAGGGGAKGRATIRFKGETPFITLRLKKGTIKGVARAVNESGALIGVQSVVTYRTTTVWQGLVILDKAEHAVQTNPDGTFEIPNALVGPYVLTVHNAFYGEKTIRGELFFHGEVQEHEVVFQSNGSIRGRVLDWDGRTPVEGATVHLRHPNFSVFDLTTDAEGRFNFDLVPPEVQRFPIDAEIDDGVTYRTARVWVRFDRYGQELDVDLVLQSQGTVSGFVEDANGVVVPGAVVTLREHGFPRRQFVQNADGEGFFSFRNIFTGRVSLSAKAPSLGGLSTTTELSLTAEGEAGFAVLTLEATGEIVGTVVSPVDGLPVPSVQVGLYQWGRGLFDAVTADQFGQFRFDRLPLAQYRVLVFDPRTGRYGLLDGVWIEFNNHVRDVEVRLEVRGDVDGHLREPGTETPVPAATVRLVSYAIVPFTTYSSTDVEGYFEFLGIPEGTFSLRSKEPEGRRRASGQGEITMEGQRVTVDLYLEDSGTVTGSVLNPPGQPAGLFPNVNVLIRQDGNVIGATLDNPFTFTGVIADRPFELLAVEMGGDHEGIASGMLTTQGEVVTVDVPIKPIGGVGITVTDSFGVPVAGADVKVFNYTFYGRQFFSNGLTFFGTSDATGRVVFQGVGEGTVSVSATDPFTNLRGSGTGTIDQDGVVVEIPVQLQDSGDIAGRALLSDGLTPAEGALVVVTTGGRTYQTFADANGDFSFTAVPMGSFQLYVTEADSGPGQIERSGVLSTNGELADFGVLVLDDINPAVVSFDPVPDSRDLPRTTAVTVVFSEPLDTSRASGSWFSFQRFSGGSVSYTLTWPDASTAVLTPNSLLDNFTGYVVIVKDAVDPAGRHLSDPKRTLFYTQDTIPPTVLEVDPRPDQNQVPVTANITVTFSEPVEATSLKLDSFQLTDLQTGVGVTTTFQQLIGERKVRLTPATGLLSDRQYQLTVQGVRDGSGNTMSTPVTTTFWTVDTIPPDITSVVFPSGTDFDSGDPVPVTVQATDFWGVASATVRLGPGVFVDADPTQPFEISAFAPYVSVAGAATVYVDVADIYGNVATQERTIQVTPRVNLAPPAAHLGCFASGDRLLAGREAEVRALTRDDEAVESVRFLVDGMEMGAVSYVNDGDSLHSFLWTPPAGTLPGASFTLRVEARDYAGNVTFEEVLVTVLDPALVRAGGGSLSDVVPGSDLILDGGTYFATGPLDVGSLLVLRGSQLVTTDPQDQRGVVTVTGDLKVECGAELVATSGDGMEVGAGGTLHLAGSLDVNELGYPGGDLQHTDGYAPSGVLAASDGGGGGHGGQGGETDVPSGNPGAEFDSVYWPQLSGGGGAVGGPTSGGPGGGVAILQATTVILDGEIQAQGGSRGGYAYGAGAGGSVRIQTGLLRGVGGIDASGGFTTGGDSVTAPSLTDPNCRGGIDGGGGGGRVALHVGSLQVFQPATQVKAWGGAEVDCGEIQSYASAGTVYVRSTGQTYGDLLIDQGLDASGNPREGAAPTRLPALGSGSVALFEVSGTDAWVTGGAAFAPRWWGARVQLIDASGADLGSFEVAEIEATGRIRLLGAGTVVGAVSYQGAYFFDGLSLRASAGLDAADPVHIETDPVVFDSDQEAPPELTAPGMTVQSGAVVRPASGKNLAFEVSGMLTVEAGGTIDLTGLGWPGAAVFGGTGQAPAGVAGSTVRAGGSHGGAGTDGSSGGAAGDVFGSVYKPRESGGGGGYYGRPGGAGGGALELDVGTLVLDGELLARGQEYASDGTAGAGGSVLVHAQTMQGTGQIDVRGGDAFVFINTAGAGGGGRVALQVGTLTGFDPVAQVNAHGGLAHDNGVPVQYAAPGTVLVRQTGQLYGDLMIDAGLDAQGQPRPSSVTELPELGSGAVTAFEVAGSDAWVSSASAFLPRWVGAWMVLLDGVGAELGSGPFEVTEIDAAGRVRLAGAGTLTGAASFRGEYRFDDVTPLNGAGVASVSPIHSSNMVLEGNVAVDSEIVATDVTVKTGAVVRPSSGGSLRMVVSGTMTVEAGAVIDLTGLGWPGGVSGQPSGQAPAGVTGSTERAGGSHGGAGSESTSTSTPGDPGEVFGSVYRPRERGGGGGFRVSSGAQAGGAGGGALELEVGTLILNGELRARGLPSAAESASGAGGSVMVRALSMQGTGVIDVRGADYDEPSLNESQGAGGGGRVSLDVGTLTGFDLVTQVKAWGGTGWNGGTALVWAAPGTVLVKSGIQTYGDLLIDPGLDGAGQPRPAGVTELPELGSGTVSLFGVEGSDAWVTGTSGFLPRWEGAWMVLLDGAGAELGAGPFEVIEVDATGRARLAGAATVMGATSFRGEYRFDNLTLLNGAGVESTSPIQGGVLVLEGEAEIDPEIVATTATVKSGAVVRPSSGGTLHMVVSGTLTVEAGGAIDLTGLGWPGGVSSSTSGQAPPAVTGSTQTSGGSHGGEGTGGNEMGPGLPGPTFGSVYLPRELGGGGAYFNKGGRSGAPGGGAIELEVGTLVLDGELRARAGEWASDGTGGAGGSVLVRAQTMQGVGKIDVRGGDSFTANASTFAGAGGGGRVSLQVSTLTFDPAGQVLTRGGIAHNNGVPKEYAAPGTVLVRKATQTYGELILDPGLDGLGLPLPGGVTVLPELGSGTVSLFEVEGSDAWVTAATAFMSRWEGVWVVLLDGTGAELGGGPFEVAEVDATGRARLAGAGTVMGATSFRGEYRFDALTLLNGAGVESTGPILGGVLVLEGEAEIDPEIVATSATVKSGAVVRPSSGSKLHMVVSGTLTVEAGGAIDLTGLGWPGGLLGGTGQTPAGLMGSTEYAGGSHGGEGTGGASGDAGEVFGSVYQPREAGGGAGYYRNAGRQGGRGGGALELDVGSLVLEGGLIARGEEFPFEGTGGAGGSILVRAQTMQGTGQIDVRGGDAFVNFNLAGAGGGGRVSLDVGTLTGFDPATQVEARGGTARGNGSPAQQAAPGTVLVKQGGQLYGDLRVEHSLANGLTPPPTALPEIHKGIVGAIQVDTLDPTDLWIEPTDPAKLHSLGVIGMWVRIGGVDYPVLDESADRRGLLLDGTAGSVQVGDAYLGVYKFDTVTVAGTAALVINDATDDVGQFVVDPGASLQVLDVFPPVITVTDPVAGASVPANALVTVTVETSDESTVSQVSFELGGTSMVDTEPPWQGTVTTPDVTVPTAVSIHIEATDSEGNVGTIDHPVTVDPAVVVAPPPQVAVDCPTPGVRAAPGAGLQLLASASHADGVDRLEVLLGDDPTVLDTDLTAPYQLRFDVPVTAVEGDVLQVKIRAWSTVGTSADAVLSVPVVEGTVLTANAYLGPGDTSLDGGSVIVTGGAVLTVEGPHTFRDLIVVDSGGVDHPVSTASTTYTLDLNLTRDLIVGCGGVVDAAGHGLPGGVVPYGSAASWVGATHAGQGGLFNGAGRIYGNLFDPSDPGGGGGTGGGAGGGVIRIAAAGQMVIDGQVSAAGVDHATSNQARGAGGSIRLDAVSILGSGVIDVSGGGGPNVTGSGSGGRIALYGGSIDAALVDRSTAAGGESYATSRRGAAGTLYVELDSQVSGDLILDNAGQISDHYTEIPSVASSVAGSGVVGSGVVDSVTANSITDLEATFPYSLVGTRVAFNGDRTTLWTVTGHTDGGQTLNLDTVTTPLAAVAGDTYEILYRFDRVVVRNGARGITLSDVLDATPEVDGTSSWTSGYQPALTVTQPVAGTQLTAGQNVTFGATVADVFGLATAVSFTFNGETTTDSTAPYQATYFVPPATVASTIPISVTVTDLAGHALEDRPSFDWLPSTNTSAPTVVLDSGPVEGEIVEASRVITLAFTATDDELLFSHRFLVDGAVQSETTQVNQASVTSSVTWTPPAGAAPGTIFTLRIEGEDFAGNIGALQRTVVISDPALSGNQSLDSTYNGQDLVLGAGTFTVIEPITLASLRLLRNAWVVPDASGRLDLTVTGELHVQDGAFVDATGLGYPGGTSAVPLGGVPSWVTGPSPDAGGAHGGVGVGWNVLGPSGEEYDSVYVPDLPGGGGSQDNDGSGNGFPGGGVLVIDAGSAVLDGEIRARGKDYNREGGGGSAAGGGGSIRLRASSLTGVGLVDVSGGNANACSSSSRVGPGGGGRVALEVDSLAGFDPASQVQAWGGRLWWCNGTNYYYGAPGTVLVRTLASTYGDLRIDAGLEPSTGVERTQNSSYTALPALGVGGVTTVEVSGTDLWVTSDVPLRPRWLGAWMVLEDAAGVELGTYEVVALDGTTRALLAGAAVETGAVSYRGEYRFDRIDLVHGLGLASSDVIRASGEVVLDGTALVISPAVIAQNLRVASGSAVTVVQGDRLELSVPGTLTVEAGAVLDVSGLGYAGGTSADPIGGGPSWVTGPSPDAGGAHGGVGIGWNVIGPSGEEYDSVYVPDLSGGGGSQDNDGSGNGFPGGGVLVIDAGSVVLDGEIRARGKDYNNVSGGGSAAGGGGSVRLRAGSLSGTGLVDASGGFSNGCLSSTYLVGPGGGGRVALDVDSLSGFDVASQVRTWGGALWWCSSAFARYAAPGTIFVRTLSSTYGDLRIDAGTESDGSERSLESTFTSLPSLGSGAVVAVEVSALDLWVTSDVPLHPRWLGAWMVLEDATGADLETYEVVELDGTTRALLAGAAAETAAATFRGEYRFDRVDVLNGAGLASTDVVRASEEVLAQGTGAQLPASTLVAQNLRIPTGSTVTVTDGDRLELSVVGTLTVETGAVLDVGGLGYTGGTSSQPNGGAPPNVTGPAPDAGGGHGGFGVGWNVVGPSGEIYDSVFAPDLPGAGGSQDNDGSGDGFPGGGVVVIAAGSVVLDGEIRARGTDNDNAGGGGSAAGAGGTVRIQASSLTGTGLVDASGGFSRGCSSSSAVVGPGGGGRVALLIDSLISFDAATQIRARGGARWWCSNPVADYAGPGTVYVLETTDTHGHLMVDQAGDSGKTVPTTLLPTPGTGIVGIATPDATTPADLWVEPQDPLALFDLGVTGMWLRIAGADYRILDQTTDRRQVLLEGAAGIVGVGDTYQGVYKLDSVTARGGTILQFLDTAEIGTLDVDVDSQVITP